jgi:hypothetical protein
VLNLTLKGVEVFIKRFNSENKESYWDNYDLIIWKKTPNGFTSVKGSFRKENWGISEKFSVDEDGMWRIPTKYVKHFK